MKRKKTELIPPGKGKKIIYLDRRGRATRVSPLVGVLRAFGVLCLLYCVFIFLFMGFGTWFFLIWGVLAAFAFAASAVFGRPFWRERTPEVVKILAGVAVGGCIVLFLIVEGMIFSRFGARGTPGADYCIVLGAQWKGDQPSYVLKKRLDAAVTYLESNPQTKVIVSGGQGADEVISEAEGMKQYLLDAGIAKERILTEAESTSTRENLAFSAALCDKANDRIVLVTNNFHMYRALQIARRQGYAQIEGEAAGSYPAMLPNNLLREFLGILKDWAAGNL